MEKDTIEELINEFAYGKDGNGECISELCIAGYIFDGKIQYLESNMLKRLYDDNEFDIDRWMTQFTINEYQTLLLVMTDIGLVVQNMTLSRKSDTSTLSATFGESSLIEIDESNSGRLWMYAENIDGKLKYVTHKDLPMYLLERDEYVDYEEFESILVVCKNEDEAKRIMLTYHGYEKDSEIIITMIGKSCIDVNHPVVPITDNKGA